MKAQSKKQWFIKAKTMVLRKKGKLLSSLKDFTGPRPSGIKVRCADGHVWKTSAYNLVSSKHWCKRCNLKKAWISRLPSFSELQRIAQKRGGRCISKEYLGSHTHLKWQCKKGHTWLAKPTNIKSGKWCPKCRNEGLSDRFRTKNAIQKYSELAKKRGGRLLTKKVPRNQGEHLKWKCQQGHVFSAKINNVISGKWCRTCSSGRGERIVRSVFEQVFSAPFPSSWPDWLNFKGTRRQLDGYNERLKLAFEHQGYQHYRPGFKASHRGYLNIKAGDKYKKAACKKRGILLVTVPEVPSITPVEKIRDVVAVQIQKRRRRLPTGFWSKEIKHDYAWNSNIYDRIKKAAEAKGGRLISKVYLGIAQRHEFECAKGHRWSTSAGNVDRNISWCPYCWAKRRAKVAKEVGERRVAKSSLKNWRDFAKKHQGKLLLRRWQNGSLPAPWMCKCGTIFKRPPNKMIRDKFWRCPKCSPNRYSEGVMVSRERRFGKQEFAKWKKHARRNGGQLLLKRWQSGRSKAPWKCARDHIFYHRPTYLLKEGLWCPECRQNAALYKWMAYAKTKGGRCLLKKRQDGDIVAPWRCLKGHLFKRQPNYLLKYGKWCPTCFNQ
jgi:hypothetical protein